MPAYAVIGAGLAGMACARRLRAAGLDVRVFDKGRRPGGRLATRDREQAAFDHGAQYFTVRDAGFADLVAGAVAAGCAARWVPRWPGGEQETQDLWVGVPGMASLSAWLATGLDVKTGCRITALSRSGRHWALQDESGRWQGDRYDAVILALPAPQAAALAGGHTGSAGRVAGVPMSPCWTVMAAFEQPVAAPLDAHWGDDPVLPWFARNTSKPGRTGPDAWVLHAGGDWSRQRLEAAPQAIQQALLARLAWTLGATLPAAAVVKAHRWLHSRVETPLGEPYVADVAAGIYFCGDWCLDARVEAAFLSGDALGRRLATGDAA